MKLDQTYWCGLVTFTSFIIYFIISFPWIEPTLTFRLRQVIPFPMSCDVRGDCACRDPDALENNKGSRHRPIGWASNPAGTHGPDGKSFLYMLLIRGSLHSHHTPYQLTCPCFLIQQQPMRVWHLTSKNKSMAKHVNNRFQVGRNVDVLRTLYGNSSRRQIWA